MLTVALRCEGHHIEAEAAISILVEEIIERAWR
jgi:hypothetical protein